MISYENLFKHAKVKDRIIPSSPFHVKFGGMLDCAFKSITDGLFLKLDEDALVSWFKDRSDPFAAGEFFGKILRSAANICAYTGDKRLKAKIDSMIRKLLLTKDQDGCISTVKREFQPVGSNGSDLWERKYVLLGLFEYFENFGPTLDKENDIYDAMIALAEYTAGQIGDEPGKTNISETGWAFCGIESSSILEPVMKLYLVSGNEKLLKFGEYIVNSGCCSRENIFEAALSCKSPFKIGSNGNPKESIAKAYEMMSCFEGLLDFYRATGYSKHLKAAENLIAKINEEEITLLGSGGGDAPYNLGPGKGEQWNRTRYEILNPDMDLAMETCVTVTYMKLLYKAYLVTGNISYIAKAEISLYNALLGALSLDGSYFEYFPKFNGTRRVFDNFSYKVGDMNLSCCTANGPMGFAIVPKLAVVKDSSSANTYCINLYTQMSYDDGAFSFVMKTLYPENGSAEIEVSKAPANGICLKLRIPEFTDSYEVKKNGKKADFSYENKECCTLLARVNKGDRMGLKLSYGIKVQKSLPSINPLTPVKYFLTYGPCVLTLDESFYKQDLENAVIPEEAGEFEIISGGAENLKNKPFRIVFDGKEFIPYFAAGRIGGKETAFISCYDIR